MNDEESSDNDEEDDGSEDESENSEEEDEETPEKVNKLMPKLICTYFLRSWSCELLLELVFS